MAFTLPELPFDSTKLAPFCSKETFEFHHGKHHANYVNKLNDLTKETPMAEMSVDALIMKAYSEGNKPVFNNVAQHFNHSFFWNCMSPEGGAEPTGKLAELIIRDFGSVEKFKETFTATATTLFGSGWAWLAQTTEGKLEILAMKDAETPMIVGKKAILTLDVWEHAYYIDHRNARANFIAEFWKVVNWKFAESQLS
ncbi:superoxide dismutase [Candidatus Peregrinibacteria bacterium]|nr:superoxide dismutase [Candidatus Peregrinibacteria bacterium]